MNCVVCGQPIMPNGEAYRNAWEKTRKRYPCCGDRCASMFDPDVHWLPAVQPRAATADDERRLLGVCASRLRDGDAPRVVVRDMLLAGIPPVPVRKLVCDNQIEASATNGAQRTAGVLAVIALLLGGGFWMRRKDPRDPAAFDAALEDLDAWDSRWRVSGPKPA